MVYYVPASALVLLKRSLNRVAYIFHSRVSLLIRGGAARGRCSTFDFHKSGGRPVRVYRFQI